MNVSNVNPIEILPYYDDDISQDLTSDLIKSYIANIIEPIWSSPLASNKPIYITDDAGKALTPDDVANIILNNFSSGKTNKIEKELNDFFANTLSNFKPLDVNSLFVAQSFGVTGGLRPSAAVIYDKDDIKSACKEYLQTRDKNVLITNFSFVISDPCIMVGFLTDSHFDDFKKFITNITIGMQLDVNTQQKFNEFNNLKLNLIDGLILRANENDSQEANSFPRIFMKLLLAFCNQTTDVEIIPSYLDELLNPTNIILFNIEKCAKAPANKLEREINIVKSGLTSPIKIISQKKLSMCSTIATINKHMLQKAANAAAMASKDPNVQKRGKFLFKKKSPTKHDYAKFLKNVIKREMKVSRTENFIYAEKSSFLRANRRQPDNIDAAGKILNKIHKPDIHIYLDTSGSISEDNYKYAILMLIDIAKELNINLFFNSFSHVLSSTTKLNIQNKSKTEIYKEFQKIDKVGGGTDYKQIWDFINMSKKRQSEISLIISDFEYSVPTTRFIHPRKLYYLPIDTSKYMYQHLVSNAKDFCSDMYRIDPNIRQKCIL